MIKKLHYLITDLILSIKYFNKIDKKNTQNTFFLFQMKKKKKFIIYIIEIASPLFFQYVGHCLGPTMLLHCPRIKVLKM